MEEYRGIHGVEFVGDSPADIYNQMAEELSIAYTEILELQDKIDALKQAIHSARSTIMMLDFQMETEPYVEDHQIRYALAELIKLLKG